MSPLPQALRRRTPDAVRRDPRLRAVALAAGLIPPRPMHSPAEAALLAELAAQARTVVEIGVFEGSSAVVLGRAMAPGSVLHLVDPYGHHPSALRPGDRAVPWATRRAVERAVGSEGPGLAWHVATSAETAAGWAEPVDLVWVDGDHAEDACALDWELWHPHVVPGGRVGFHDARGGLPGPAAVVDRLFRGAGAVPGWALEREVDTTVVVRRERP